jgi:hypothetical protein
VTSPQQPDPQPVANDSLSAPPPPEAGSLSGVDHLPTHWGSGWISGVLSIGLGIVGLGAVLCLHFLSLLTMPDLRGKYPLLLVRGVHFAVLIASFVLGLVSVWLRERKILGITGLLLTLAAMLLGGASAPVGEVSQNSPYLGLDWFLLNLIFFSLVFAAINTQAITALQRVILGHFAALPGSARAAHIRVDAGLLPTGDRLLDPRGAPAATGLRVDEQNQAARLHSRRHSVTPICGQAGLSVAVIWTFTV